MNGGIKIGDVLRSGRNEHIVVVTGIKNDDFARETCVYIAYLEEDGSTHIISNMLFETVIKTYWEVVEI